MSATSCTLWGANSNETRLSGIVTVPPDGRTLYVNAYGPARTLAITGPWHRVRS
jgi:hypothetical protein